MGFRMKTAIPVGYKRQGFIYFNSQAYRDLGQEQKGKIEHLCRTAAGDDWKALFEYVTTDKGATIICEEHHIGKRAKLFAYVHKYYLAFPKRL